MQPEPDERELLEGLELDAPLVGILMGSQSDAEVMDEAAKELDDAGHQPTR